MTGLDWIFVVALLASIALGVWRGFVYEVLSVLNWLLAFVLAQWLGDAVGQHLPIDTGSDSIRHVVGFVLVFVLSVFVGGLLVWGLPKLVERAGLRPVDRGLGGVFGLVRAVILTLALAVLVQMTPARNQAWWRDSLLADTSMWTLKKLKPVMPEGVGKYFP